MFRLLAALFALSLSLPAYAAAPLPRVRLETSAGPIVIEVDTVHAPITGANFLAYVDEKRFDDTRFYRAARSRRDPKQGLVQGGLNHNMRRSKPPIVHEPTSRTGLHHIDATVSMARNENSTAMGDFFIIVGNQSGYLDATPRSIGYAAFGRVVSGMDVVRRILALPTYPGGWSQQTIGQAIRDQVKITRAIRIR